MLLEDTPEPGPGFCSSRTAASTGELLQPFFSPCWAVSIYGTQTRHKMAVFRAAISFESFWSCTNTSADRWVPPDPDAVMEEYSFPLHSTVLPSLTSKSCSTISTVVVQQFPKLLHTKKNPNKSNYFTSVIQIKLAYVWPRRYPFHQHCLKMEHNSPQLDVTSEYCSVE